MPLPIPDKYSDEQILAMLYPKRGRNEEYDKPDFEAIRKDKVKRKLTLYVAWRRYYKRTIAAGKKAYQKTQFFKLFHRFFRRLQATFKTKVLDTYCALIKKIDSFKRSDVRRIKAMAELNDWLKKMGLNEDIIIPRNRAFSQVIYYGE